MVGWAAFRCCNYDRRIEFIIIRETREIRVKRVALTACNVERLKVIVESPHATEYSMVTTDLSDSRMHRTRRRFNHFYFSREIVSKINQFFNFLRSDINGRTKFSIRDR